MTKRAILLGSILSLAIGLILPVTEFLIQGTRLGLSSATPAAFFLLFVTLIGPQFLLKCLKPKWAFKRGELLVIFGMMMVATVIPTRGFGGPFFSMITGATYYASEENEWAKFIQPHLSEMVVVKDSNAVRLMYEGLEGAPILWDAWIRPLGWWSFFVLCMATMVISAMFLLRKTWIERERLVFPVAQVALAMVEEGAKNTRFGPLFRSPLFWFGFLIPMTLESLNALNRYFPVVPPLQAAMVHTTRYSRSSLSAHQGQFADVRLRIFHRITVVVQSVVFLPSLTSHAVDIRAFRGWSSGSFGSVDSGRFWRYHHGSSADGRDARPCWDDGVDGPGTFCEGTVACWSVSYQRVPDVFDGMVYRSSCMDCTDCGWFSYCHLAVANPTDGTGRHRHNGSSYHPTRLRCFDGGCSQSRRGGIGRNGIDARLVW